MTTEAFAYWLKGYFEIENPKQLNELQTQIIKDHLEQVFTKLTPERNKLPDFEFTPPAPVLYCHNGTGKMPDNQFIC